MTDTPFSDLFPRVSVRRTMRYQWRRPETVARPSHLVLDTGTMEVWRSSSGMHTIEASEPTPHWDAFAAEFGEIRERTNRVLLKRTIPDDLDDD